MPVGGDLGTAAAATQTSMQADLEGRTAALAITNASPAERADIASAFIENQTAAVASLLDADRALAQAWLDGDRTGASIAHELAVAAANASARQEALARIGALDGMVPALDLSRESDAVAARFAPLAAPPRQVALRGATDPASRTTIATTVTDDGLGLSAIHGDRLVTQRLRYDRLDDGESTIDELEAAASIARAAIPDSTETTAVRHLGDGYYDVELAMPDGAATAYVSGAAEAVVATERYRWIEALTFEVAATDTEFETDVTLERSEAGALRVSAVDSATGEAVSARVYLGHGDTWTPLGPLEAGQLVAPDPGGAFELRLVTDLGTITVDADG